MNAHIRDEERRIKVASITDYARMCKALGGRCSDCPLSNLKDKYIKNCAGVLSIRTSEASAIIDKWCAEHPQKTYKQDFLEKFPNASKTKRGTPEACRKKIYGGKCVEIYDNGCLDCWNEVMPEETGNE